tara:strand:+ start:5345 stop:5740 length:396 start_codon:yes stop_codon:yes gene_type:complete
MDLYTYVASSNPYQAKAILHKYGYSIKDARTESDLGQCLKSLVAYEGEDAFHDILDSHPDKGVIVEIYAKQNVKSEDTKKCNCNGNSCSCNREHYFLNASGNDTPSKSVRETSIYIMAAALLLAAAIIVKR